MKNLENIENFEFFFENRSFLKRYDILRNTNFKRLKKADVE